MDRDEGKIGKAFREFLPVPVAVGEPVDTVSIPIASLSEEEESNGPVVLQSIEEE